jgi:hypothetical protein
MVEHFASRSGLPSLRVNGVALHSPYDPAAEARRWAREALGTTPAATVVILGEGLGYLGAAVSDFLPGARLVTVCYSSEADRHAVHRAAAAWTPSAPVGLGAFLRASIGELDVEGLKVVEWPASARVFPDLSRQANLAVRTVVRELNGSCVTVAAMGRSWIRCAIWNLAAIESALEGTLCPPDRPVVIAASGPTLRRCLPDIARARSGVELWALPSAACALARAGLRPDLVVLTDAGHWAMVHLHFAGPACPIVMPLSAARGSWRIGSPVRLLDQGTLLERQLFDAAGIEAPRAAPHGTVAATALELALASTSAPVTLAGLDLCAFDSETHVRPNAFDTLLRAGDERLFPHHGTAYARARTGESDTRIVDGVRIRLSRSLEAYAGWLAHRASASQGRVYRLNPSPVELPGTVATDGSGLAALARSAPAGVPGPLLHPDPRWPSAGERRDAVRSVLSRWSALLERGAARAQAGGWAEALAESPELADLAWHAAARDLLEAKRRQRLGDPAGAQAVAVALLDDAAVFIRSLGERLTAGASAP